VVFKVTHMLLLGLRCVCAFQWSCQAVTGPHGGGEGGSRAKTCCLAVHVLLHGAWVCPDKNRLHLAALGALNPEATMHFLALHWATPVELTSCNLRHGVGGQPFGAVLAARVAGCMCVLDLLFAAVLSWPG
jgi:hypothetical protein